MIEIVLCEYPYKYKDMGLYKPANLFNRELLETLYKNLVGIQVRFNSSEISNKELSFLNIDLFLKKYSEHYDIKNYFFVSEPNTELHSKVRSYKGLPYNKTFFSKNYYIEKEYEIVNNETIISGLVKINPETLYIVNEQFWGSGYQFILSSFKESLFDFSVLEKIVSTFEKISGPIYLDYLKLAKLLCLNENPCAIIYYNIAQLNFRDIPCINFLINKADVKFFLPIIESIRLAQE